MAVAAAEAVVVVVPRVVPVAVEAAAADHTLAGEGKHGSILARGGCALFAGCGIGIRRGLLLLAAERKHLTA
jgi:hypothetical protein